MGKSSIFILFHFSYRSLFCLLCLKRTPLSCAIWTAIRIIQRSDLNLSRMILLRLTLFIINLLSNAWVCKYLHIEIQCSLFYPDRYPVVRARTPISRTRTPGVFARLYYLPWHYDILVSRFRTDIQ